MQAHRQMKLDGERITAQGVIDRYLGRDATPVIMLLDLFREHNEKCHKLSGNGMAPGTVERYETSLRHAEAFSQFKFGKNDMPLKICKLSRVSRAKICLADYDSAPSKGFCASQQTY